MDNKDKKNNTKMRPRHDNQLHRYTILDSQGPERKIKGTALELFERYMAYGQDAAKEGSVEESENFYQHAEHYRILHASFKDQVRSERRHVSRPVQSNDVSTSDNPNKEQDQDAPVVPVVVTPTRRKKRPTSRKTAPETPKDNDSV